MVTRMNSGELGKEVAEAETQIQLHNERKAEIDGRKTHFSKVREHGNGLIEIKHYASEEIQKTVGQLDKTKLSLNGAWEKRNHLLKQCHDLRVSSISVDSEEPVQPPFKLRNSKWYSVSSLTIIEYSSD